jgi:hypothetical protein
MKTKITRRKMLSIGSAVGSAAVGSAILGSTRFMAAPAPSATLPWEWKEIKPADIQERAYQSAWSKVACMYGTFEAVIGTLADKYGAPYNAFPVEATLYGSGGVGGIGSLCGTINACGMLFSLFAKNQDDIFALCQEMSLWYEKADLPRYKPKDARLDIPIVKSVAGSNLCHVSSTAWANASGHKLLTPEHFERCNRLVADVTMQAVAMLNSYSKGKIVYAEKLNSFSQACLACHGPEKEKANVASGMTCNPCHEDPH